MRILRSISSASESDGYGDGERENQEWAVRGALRTLFANQFKKELGLRVDGDGLARRQVDAELLGETVDVDDGELHFGTSHLPSLEECRTRASTSPSKQAACELQAISAQVQSAVLRSLDSGIERKRNRRSRGKREKEMNRNLSEEGATNAEEKELYDESDREVG